MFHLLTGRSCCTTLTELRLFFVSCFCFLFYFTLSFSKFKCTLYMLLCLNFCALPGVNFVFEMVLFGLASFSCSFIKVVNNTMEFIHSWYVQR